MNRFFCPYFKAKVNQKSHVHYLQTCLNRVYDHPQEVYLHSTITQDQTCCKKQALIHLGSSQTTWLSIRHACHFEFWIAGADIFFSLKSVARLHGSSIPKQWFMVESPNLNWAKESVQISQSVKVGFAHVTVRDVQMNKILQLFKKNLHLRWCQNTAGFWWFFFEAIALSSWRSSMSKFTGLPTSNNQKFMIKLLILKTIGHYADQNLATCMIVTSFQSQTHHPRGNCNGVDFICCWQHLSRKHTSLWDILRCPAFAWSCIMKLFDRQAFFVEIYWNVLTVTHIVNHGVLTQSNCQLCCYADDGGTQRIDPDLGVWT